ncbi:small acidic protein family-domain-containing protein [Whalleya microplaca]|nr:small acidic protein family-domain-containing protein [Whalleya microplaca]
MEADPSPWEKLDPEKLRREAIAKEAKLKRKEKLRLQRAEERKEKRHLKSEAKQARKANVGRAAKWNEERRAADKLKKLANRPHKQEKRRRRLHLRAAKLEAQAKKLMADAQKAKVRAEYLDQLAKEGNSDQKTDGLENDDYIPIEETNGDAAATTNDVSMTDATTASTKEEVEKPAEPEKEKKQRKKEKAEKRKRGEDESHEAPKDVANGDADADVKAAQEAETPEKKKKKKRKVEEATEEDGSNEGAKEADTPETKKDKKDKKKKREEKEKAEKSVPSPAVDGKANTDVAEQWNAQALEGSDKRKEKFLRLLGAKKSNGVAATNGENVPVSSKADITRMQSDLERQFDTGMRMKHEGHGHRKGLGA